MNQGSFAGFDLFVKRLELIFVVIWWYTNIAELN